MTAGLVLLAVGVWLAWPGSSRRRLPVAAAAASPRLPVTGMAAALLGVAVALLVTGLWGLVLGVAAGLLAGAVLRRIKQAGDRDSEDTSRQAPDAVDCLASCLAAGAPLWTALRVVAHAFGDPLRGMWLRSAERHELGSAPAETFSEWLSDPALAAAGRVLVRSSESGGALTTALVACAQRLREERAEALEVKARAVGVKAVAPLGGCFLPAFILIAVVPIVGSLVSAVL